jgi:hypothetical protein
MVRVVTFGNQLVRYPSEREDVSDVVVRWVNEVE